MLDIIDGRDLVLLFVMTWVSRFQIQLLTMNFLLLISHNSDHRAAVGRGSARNRTDFGRTERGDRSAAADRRGQFRRPAAPDRHDDAGRRNARSFRTNPASHARRSADCGQPERSHPQPSNEAAVKFDRKQLFQYFLLIHNSADSSRPNPMKKFQRKFSNVGILTFSFADCCHMTVRNQYESSNSS